MRTIIIDSNNFNTLDGFYDQIEKELIEGNCPWGRNLDSLDEVVSYSFNYTGEIQTSVEKIIWLNIEKSRSELTDTRGGISVVDILENIFKSNPHIVFETR